MAGIPVIEPSNGNRWIGMAPTVIGRPAFPPTGRYDNGATGRAWHRRLQWTARMAGKDGGRRGGWRRRPHPFIGSNGNWWIGSTDTGIPSTATGADGRTGADGQDGQDGQNGAGIADVKINDNGELIVTLTDGTELNAGVVWTEEMAAAMDQGDIASLRTMVYVALAMAGVSLAGLIATLAFLLVKRKIPIGK